MLHDLYENPFISEIIAIFMETNLWRGPFMHRLDELRSAVMFDR